jgi:hypothetical protein
VVDLGEEGILSDLKPLPKPSLDGAPARVVDRDTFVYAAKLSFMRSPTTPVASKIW